ncbi:hypothetical protein, partial [Sphingobacterium sp. SGG-5]|uniref:hypothetical protein n=1 Tax=Sphingobacterium sp. SGG-5 TaxID=2710881 RepID=UPI0019CFA60C
MSKCLRAGVSYPLSGTDTVVSGVNYHGSRPGNIPIGTCLDLFGRTCFHLDAAAITSGLEAFFSMICCFASVAVYCAFGALYALFKVVALLFLPIAFHVKKIYVSPPAFYVAGLLG